MKGRIYFYDSSVSWGNPHFSVLTHLAWAAVDIAPIFFQCHISFLGSSISFLKYFFYIFKFLFYFTFNLSPKCTKENNFQCSSEDLTYIGNGSYFNSIKIKILNTKKRKCGASRHIWIYNFLSKYIKHILWYFHIQ